jgi:hypothetical protein
MVDGCCVRTPSGHRVVRWLLLIKLEKKDGDGSSYVG